MAALVIKNPSGVMTYSGLSLIYVRGRLLIQCSISVRGSRGYELPCGPKKRTVSQINDDSMQ